MHVGPERPLGFCSYPIFHLFNPTTLCYQTIKICLISEMVHSTDLTVNIDSGGVFDQS